ncbi:MAG: hypothetical protein AB1896_22910 [Thermodesulfobacteriota bacterium]
MKCRTTARPFLFASFVLFMLTACLALENIPESPDLPEHPVEKAAVLGLYNSYRESTLWQLREPEVLSVQPITPTKDFVQEHDPKELYCVCVEYEARYRVPWTTVDRSPWEKTIRNILVIKTQGDHYLAMRPSALCPPLCQ